MAAKKPSPHIRIKFRKDGSVEINRVGYVGKTPVKSATAVVNLALPMKPRTNDLKAFMAQIKAGLADLPQLMEDQKAEVQEKMLRMVKTGTVNRKPGTPGTAGDGVN